MPQRKRKTTDKVESDLGLEGFERFFDSEADKKLHAAAATIAGESLVTGNVEAAMVRFGELIALTVDQRAETAKIANQLIENQRQLIATQQILIRLMERSIDLTRHITGIEEKLPAVFELPRLFDALRVRVAALEGVEVD